MAIAYNATPDKIEINGSFDSGTATAGAATTLTDSTKSATWTTDSNAERIIYITGGTGAGQSRKIVSNTSTVLTVDHDWDTQPDNTSVYQICYNGADMVGAVTQASWLVDAARKLISLTASVVVKSGGYFGEVGTSCAFENDRNGWESESGGFLQLGFITADGVGQNGGLHQSLLTKPPTTFYNPGLVGINRLYGTSFVLVKDPILNDRSYRYNDSSTHATAPQEFTAVDCVFSQFYMTIRDGDIWRRCRFSDYAICGVAGSPTEFESAVYQSSYLTPRANIDGAELSGYSFAGETPATTSINERPVQLNNAVASGERHYFISPNFGDNFTFSNAISWYNSGTSNFTNTKSWLLQSVDFNIIDTAGSGVAAVIAVFDSNGDGAIVSSKDGSFDPVLSNTVTANGSGQALNTKILDALQVQPTTPASVGQSKTGVTTTYSPWTVKLAKYGYVAQDLVKSYSAKTSESIQLADNAYVTAADAATALAVTGLAIVGDTSLTVSTASRSINQLYDYSEAWYPSNLEFDQPLVTTDGSNYTLTTGYDLTLSGVDLTGSGTLNIGTNEVNLNSGAETTLTLNGGTINIDTVQAYVLSLTTNTVNFTTAGTYDLTGCTISGTATFTATAAVTVQVAIGTLYDDTDVNVTVVEIGDIPTLTVSADSATATVRGFTNDTQTTVFSESDGSVDYAYPNTNPIDIEIVEQGYVPINDQNVVPFDGPINYTMDLDEAYNASHSLTIVTHYTYNRATKVLDILADQNAFNVRSALADTIRTNASYFNTKLLMVAIPGLARIDQTAGMTVADMSTWKRAGSEVFDAADSTNPVKKYFAIQTVGTITGATTHYRQSSSGDSTAVTLTNNIVDESFLYYEDADHDGTPSSDLSGYALIKSFLAGSKQGRVDVLANAGISALQSTLYVVPLSNTAHDYAGTDPGISADITLVTGGTVGGKSFSYKIVDGGTNTGANIAAQLNYNAAANPNAVIPGGTGLRYFELPDMVIHNATAVETERGFREGATPTLVGFYVERGGADHPDFTRFQADDGTYYVPAVTANITVTDLINTASALDRLQIINKTALSAPLWSTGQSVTEGDIYLRSTGYGSELTAGLYLRAGNTGTTHATTEPTWSTTPGGTTVDNDITWTTYAILYEDSDPAGTGYSSSYINGAEFKSGESYEMRFAEMAGTTHFKYWSATGIASSAGFSQSASLLTDAVYATWAGLEGQDGLYFDATYSPNYVASYVVLDADLDFSGKSLGLYYCYLLTTSEGMYRFWDGFTLLDAGNLRNNDDIVDVYLDESAGFVKQTDSVRIFKKTDSSIRPVIDPTTGGAGVEANWRVPVNVVTVATGDAVNQATVQAALTAQGYTTTRAPYIDDIKTKTDQLTFTTPNVVDASASVSEASIRSAIGMASANLDTQLATITADTNELQTNQGNWLTATGFATVNPDNASIAEILTDTGTTIPAIIAALNNLSSADVTAAVPTVTQIKDGVWNATASDYHTNNTTGKVLKGIAEGWIAAEGEVNDLSATDTQFVTTLTESTSSFYSNEILIFTNGALKGQSRIISDYNGTTKAITLDHALTGAPADGVSFIILASHAHLLSEFDALLTANAVPEPTSPPAANAPLAEKIAWTFAMARNRIEQTETQQIVRADDGSTAIGTASTTDDGTTAVRGEFG